jgi:hypothetical protein
VKYAAKATVWLQIDSDYPDGLGEAQWEVECLVKRIKLGAADGFGREVSVARATDIEILAPKLREEPGESTDMLFFGDVILDNGLR